MSRPAANALHALYDAVCATLATGSDDDAIGDDLSEVHRRMRAADAPQIPNARMLPAAENWLACSGNVAGARVVSRPRNAHREPADAGDGRPRRSRRARSVVTTQVVKR